MASYEGSKRTEYFRRIKLTKDKEQAKYAPDVVYPRMQMGGRKDNSKAEMEALWLVGFADYEKMSGEDKHIQKLHNFLQLPHSNLTGAARDALQKHSRKTEKERKRQPRRDGLDEAENSRLKQLEKELMHPRKKEINAGRRAYVAENRKILHIRKHKQPTSVMAQSSEDVMSELFELQRVHTQAALTIQKSYRTYLAMQFWRNYIQKVKAATKIQRLARGMITREILKLWYMR